jgi:hypothetical protein
MFPYPRVGCAVLLVAAFCPSLLAYRDVQVSSVTTNAPVAFNHTELHPCKPKADDANRAGATHTGHDLAGWGEAIAAAEADGGSVTTGPTASAPKPPPPPAARRGQPATSTATFELSVQAQWLANAVALFPSATTPTIEVERCPDEKPAEYFPRRDKFKAAVNANIAAIEKAVAAASPLALSGPELNALLKGKTITRTISLPAFFDDQQSLTVTIVGKKVTDRALGGG